MADVGIEVRLFASLQKWKPAAGDAHENPEGMTVRDLVRGRGIPESEIAIIMINGRRDELSSTVARGDTVSLFPLIGGG